MAPTNFNSNKSAPSYITGVSNINLWCNNYVYNVSTRNRNKEKRQDEKTENNKY